MYTIPLFELNYDDREENAVLNVLKSKWISSGQKCSELEDIMKEMFGTKYALTVTNCTAALHLSLCALGIKEGDEVIVPSLTFVATVNSVMYTGAKPVFCDVESYIRPVIDPYKVEKLITNRTKAIVVMHYAGFSCDMDGIVNIAEKYGLKVVEDACHGPLSEYKGRKLGTIGDVGCFSFFSNKNVSTGEGGAVITDDAELYNKIKLLRSHGMTAMSYERSTGHAVSYDVVELGFNYRLDDIRASLGIEQFKKLEEDIVKRRSVRNKYIDRLKKIKDIIIPFEKYEDISSSYIFPIVLTDNGQKGTQKRDAIRDYLKDHGVQTSVHYPAVHKFKIYEDYAAFDLKSTEYFCDNEITLPMYSGLTDEKITYVCDTLIEAIS